MKNTGDQIISMLLAGETYRAICQSLKVSASTVAYHREQVKKYLNYSKKKYDWNAVQDYYNQGYSLNEIKRTFGMCNHTIRDAINRGDLKTLPQHSPERQKQQRYSKYHRKPRLGVEQVLIEDSPHSRHVVKRIIIELDLMPYSCSEQTCILFGIIKTMWGDKPLVLHLDHKNGIRDDHRIDNLRWLCPNCHSQTETYCGRNKHLVPAARIDRAFPVLETES